MLDHRSWEIWSGTSAGNGKSTRHELREGERNLSHRVHLAVSAARKRGFEDPLATSLARAQAGDALDELPRLGCVEETLRPAIRRPALAVVRDGAGRAREIEVLSALAAWDDAEALRELEARLSDDALASDAARGLGRCGSALALPAMIDLLGRQSGVRVAIYDGLRLARSDSTITRLQEALSSSPNEEHKAVLSRIDRLHREWDKRRHR